MMIKARAVPQDALLARYVAQPGCYTDCFEIVAHGDVELSAFIEAFYNTWLFRLERLVLSLPLKRIVRDAEVRALAQGADRFAAWRVEARADGEILLCDASGATRSYLAVVPHGAGSTRLLFGSAVVVQEGAAFPWWVNALMPLHKLYSRSLLRLAEVKLRWLSI